MAASTAVSIRVDVSLEESEVVMKKKKKDKNYSLDLFPEESIESLENNNQIERTSENKFKAIWFKEDDFNRFLTMLNDPSILSIMPKKEKGRKNRMALWCVQELIKIVNNRGLNAQQSVISFNSPETDAFCDAVAQLKEATGLLNNIFETMKKEKKDKWWNILKI